MALAATAYVPKAGTEVRTTVDQLDSTSAPADGSFLLGSLDIGGPHPYIYGNHVHISGGRY
jgi:hypothetical protein